MQDQWIGQCKAPDLADCDGQLRGWPQGEACNLRSGPSYRSGFDNPAIEYQLARADRDGVLLATLDQCLIDTIVPPGIYPCPADPADF